MMDVPSLLSELISWLPALLLIAVLLLLAVSLFISLRHSRSKSGMTPMQYLEELLQESRRHNEQLERLLATANDRLAALERKG